MALVLLLVQAIGGRVYPEAYLDPEWVRATWIGNDWVTILLAAPVLGIGIMLANHGSRRGLLLWSGGLAYGVYNGAFYMLGATLNVFFPLYVLTVVASAVALLLLLTQLEPVTLARSYSAATPSRWIGIYLLFVAAGLTTVWSAIWASHVFAGRPTPIPPEAFRLVAALDLTLLVPPLAAGGLLLWRRSPWGYLLGALASVQGTLYLLVLSVNSARAATAGHAGARAEVFLWTALALTTVVAAGLLLAGAGRSGTAPQARGRP